MKQTYPCPSCLFSLSDTMRFCPCCGKPNARFDSDAPEQAAETKADAGLHHAAATAGKCAYCDSVLYSDDKECPYCGAANPNFVVHGKAQSSGAGGSRSHGTTNASTGKCPYCGVTVRSNEPNCPKCGSVNPHYTEDTARVILQPKTIEELKEYCAERDMPLLRMRFFIGENTPEPMAFGIYREANGNTVVYKNKADRSRAVRYNGPDEAYAVAQILAKLKDECRARGIDPDHSLRGDDGARNAPQSTPSQNADRVQAFDEWHKKEKAKSALSYLLIAVAAVVVIALVLTACTHVIATCSSCLGVGSSGYGSSYGSGGSYSSGGGWDWGSDSSDSDWDWGSDSSDWDSWDSGGTDWDSDW